MKFDGQSEGCAVDPQRGVVFTKSGGHGQDLLIETVISTGRRVSPGLGLCLREDARRADRLFSRGQAPLDGPPGSASGGHFSRRVVGKGAGSASLGFDASVPYANSLLPLVSTNGPPDSSGTSSSRMSSAACSPDVALSTNSSPSSCARSSCAAPRMSSSGCSRSRAGPSSLPRSSRSSAFSSVTSGGGAATRTRGRRAGVFGRRAFAFVAAWRGADCLVSRSGGGAAGFLPTFLVVGLRFLG